MPQPAPGNQVMFCHVLTLTARPGAGSVNETKGTESMAEYSLTITVAEIATKEEVANILRLASKRAAEKLRDEGTLEVDESYILDEGELFRVS